MRRQTGTMARQRSGHCLLLSILLPALLLVGCGDDAPTRSASGLYVDDFDRFWQRFDRGYSYFAYKGIDWNAAYETYRPRAEAVTSTQELVALLREMVAPLRDLHVYFRGPEGHHSTYVSPYRHNFDGTVLARYLGAGDWRRHGSFWGTAVFDDVPYLSISSWRAGSLEIGDFDAVLEDLRDAPALVFDVRANDGGSDGLAFRVAGRFTSQRVLAEYTHYRAGPEHTDFTPLTARYLSPRGTWQYEGRVALLVGRGCFSSNESFISAMREIATVTVLGDTTGGATGNPQIHDLRDGWTYSVPRWIAYTADERVIEWNGIPPDILVPATPEDFAAGRDRVLEYALDWARQTPID